MDTRIIIIIIIIANVGPNWTRIVSKGARIIIIPKLQMGAEPITRRDPNSTTAHMGGSILFEHGSVNRDVIAATDINCTSSLSYRIVGRLPNDYC